MQKPPKLNKLSKKQLRKLYTLQWVANNELAGENAKMEKDNNFNIRQLQLAYEDNLRLEKELDYKNRLLQSITK